MLFGCRYCGRLPTPLHCSCRPLLELWSAQNLPAQRRMMKVHSRLQWLSSSWRNNEKDDLYRLGMNSYSCHWITYVLDVVHDRCFRLPTFDSGIAWPETSCWTLAPQHRAPLCTRASQPWLKETRKTADSGKIQHNLSFFWLLEEQLRRRYWPLMVSWGSYGFATELKNTWLVAGGIRGDTDDCRNGLEFDFILPGRFVNTEQLEIWRCPCSEVKLGSQYFPEGYDYREVCSSCRR